MWHAQRKRDANLEKVGLAGDGNALSFADVIALLRDDVSFRDFFIGELAATPFPAFLWEAPPLTPDNLDQTYEHVAIGSAALERMPPDPDAFGSILESKDAGSVATFRNLGGDAMLIAPRMLADEGCYGHLGAFVRLAPARQRHDFFQAVAAAIQQELLIRPRVWVSTSGLGVAWLHVRLDTWPKYYNHRPYAEASHNPLS